MGSGSPSFFLAWRPTDAAVLAANIGSLIQNPAVLLGAAAVVVVAVLIVLIMVLRGGSKKAELVQAVEEEQEAWESAPRPVPNQASRGGHDTRDQMLPWEQQGGARAEGGRQSMGGRRGGSGREAQPGWGQSDQDAPSWGESQGQPSPRGGQWVGTDEWAPSEAGMGRGNMDQRGQGPMGASENEGWPWAAGQMPQGGQNADQWGQAAGSPMGRGNDQWGQSPGNSRPRGRENDQWGQAAGSPMGRDNDQWGQNAGAPMGHDNNDQWGQGPASAPMGRGNDQWGQSPAGPPMGRGNDQWGQPPAMGGQDQWGGQAAPNGRMQDQWGGQAAPNGYKAGQAQDQGFDVRGGQRQGAEPMGQSDGQWGQGNWGQENGGWSSGDPAGQWSQPPAAAQPPQSSRPVQPGNSRPNNQGNLGGMDNQPPSSPDGGSNWGQRETPSWQAEPRRDQPSWETPSWQQVEAETTGPRNSGPRSQPQAQQQWDQPSRGSSGPAWEAGSPAGQWGQPEANPPASPSRPIEPAGARGGSQQSTPGGEWGDRDFDRPTSKPNPQSGSWEQREAPAWQSSAPQMAAPAGATDAPTVRPGAGAGRLSKVSPESTAYSAPPVEPSEGEVEKTVVIRKDAASVRAPSVVVRQGKEPGRTYDMRKDHMTIGRSRDSDIFLEDLAVSRLHATIYRDEMGGYLLRDENSANGTSVNGQRVSEVPLQEGDEIQLGQTILAFVRR